METANNDWVRITAYLSGEMNEEEKKAFLAWIESSVNNQQMFREASAIWNNSTVRLTMPYDETEQGWSDFTRKRDEKPAVRLWTTPWLRVAASITLIASVLYVINMFRDERVELVAGSSVGTFYLPDSSIAWLNKGAKLSYTRDFEGESRNVKLEGEGFFKVKPDPKKPFLVTADNVLVRVLGTSFNIRGTSDETIVSVAEGIVSVTGKAADTVTLLAGDEAIVKKNGAPLKGSISDPSFSAWRLINNPVAMYEREHPEQFLGSTARWKKNLVNMSVLEGTLANNSTLISFEKVVLRVTYLKSRGERDVFRVTIDERVAPGATIDFQKRLLDILTMTQLEKVEIESAVAAD